MNCTNTSVRSSLFIEQLASRYIDNEIANEYWEYKLPSGVARPTENTPTSQVFRFIRDKYEKRLYAPKHALDPVSEYYQNKSGLPPPPPAAPSPLENHPEVDLINCDIKVEPPAKGSSGQSGDVLFDIFAGNTAQSSVPAAIPKPVASKPPLPSAMFDFDLDATSSPPTHSPGVPSEAHAKLAKIQSALGQLYDENIANGKGAHDASKDQERFAAFDSIKASQVVTSMGGIPDPVCYGMPYGSPEKGIFCVNYIKADTCYNMGNVNVNIAGSTPAPSKASVSMPAPSKMEKPAKHEAKKGKADAFSGILPDEFM